jgi:hypothetical protein
VALFSRSRIFGENFVNIKKFIAAILILISFNACASDDQDVIITTYQNSFGSAVDADFEFPAGYNYVIAELYNLDEGLLIPEHVLPQACCAETVTFFPLQSEDVYVVKLLFVNIRSKGRNKSQVKGAPPPLVYLSDTFIAY